MVVGLASKGFGLTGVQLRVENGIVRAPSGKSAVYATLASGEPLHVRAQPTSPLHDPAERTPMGKSMQRVDIPSKVTGTPIYVQDMRPPGMVHARILRPPSYGAQLVARVAARRHEVWSHSHLTRPGPAVNLISAWHLQHPVEQPVPKPLPQPAGGGDRNAVPTYRMGDASVLFHFVPDMRVRVAPARVRRLPRCGRDRKLHG